MHLLFCTSYPLILLLPSTLEPTIGASIGGQIISGGSVLGISGLGGLKTSSVSRGTCGTSAGLVSNNCSGS